jgi:thiamine-phosphate pyrophosphorylase
VTALLGLAARLRVAKLMLITDTRAHFGDLGAFGAAVFAGGVDIIQLREPRAPADVQAAALAALEKAATSRGLVSSYGAAEIGEAVRADVLQLSAFDGSAAQARTKLGQWALIGRSCHSPAQVDAAVADPDLAFFTVSPVFNAPGVGEAGMELVRHAAKVAPAGLVGSKPWFAVGGVNLDNLDQVLAAGARRIGVTRAIAAAADPTAAAAAVAERLNAAWNDDPGMDQITFAALGD